MESRFKNIESKERKRERESDEGMEEWATYLKPVAMCMGYTHKDK
jgi:hypothetical protein